MKKRIMLDAFCGAGGATKGYQRAGFYVVGVDIAPQSHYCGDEFIQADALDFLARHGSEFEFIHTSPPCQGYMRAKGLARKGYLQLVEPVRAALKSSGRPYVIENVPGAPLHNPILLCGLMFGLDLYRHRLFETSFDVPFLWDYGHGRSQDRLHGEQRERDIVLVVGKAMYKGYLIKARRAMGIDWMNEDEIREAIPPAYTEYIGRQLMAVIVR